MTKSRRDWQADISQLVGDLGKAVEDVKSCEGRLRSAESLADSSPATNVYTTPTRPYANAATGNGQVSSDAIQQAQAALGAARSALQKILESARSKESELAKAIAAAKSDVNRLRREESRERESKARTEISNAKRFASDDMTLFENWLRELRSAIGNADYLNRNSTGGSVGAASIVFRGGWGMPSLEDQLNESPYMQAVSDEQYGASKASLAPSKYQRSPYLGSESVTESWLEKLLVESPVRQSYDTGYVTEKHLKDAIQLYSRYQTSGHR